MGVLIKLFRFWHVVESSYLPREERQRRDWGRNLDRILNIFNVRSVNFVWR